MTNDSPSSKTFNTIKNKKILDDKIVDLTEYLDFP